MTEPKPISLSDAAPALSTEGVRGLHDPKPDEVVNQYTPEIRDGPEGFASPYDDPEFQKEHAEGIAAQIEGWRRDWKIRIDAITEATGLSRSEAMQYLVLLQMGAIRGLASGFQQMWNADPAQRRRAMQDALLEAQLRDKGYNLEDRGVPISEAAKEAASRGWRIP